MMSENTAHGMFRLPICRGVRMHKDLVWISLFILLLHLVGWFTLIAIVAPQHLSVGTKAFGIGTGLTAYMLGMRHAFDADHIAAIDNTTRKLIRQGRRPHSVGFWFSCGHSSIVFVLSLLLVFGIHAVAGPVLDENSMLHTVTALVGTFVSGGFLYLIAALNLVVLYEIWTLFQQVRTGCQDEAVLEARLGRRGLISALLGKTMGVVNRPWQMFLVGVLFGLGFDTATEITLLVLTGSGAASGLPWYAILCLPVLFAAGISLMDTIDGSFMNAAYSWAVAKPARRLYYNMIVTAVSVAAALLIGTIEFVGLLSDRYELRGAVWDLIASVDLNSAGFIIVGLFATIWIAAAAVWKFAPLCSKFHHDCSIAARPVNDEFTAATSE